MTTIHAHYIKDTNYNSKQFKIIKYNEDNPTLNGFIKEYMNNNYIYIKNRHFFKKPKKNILYKIVLYFDEFQDKETDEYIEYIDRIKYKKIKELPTKQKCLIDCSSDEDN